MVLCQCSSLLYSPLATISFLSGVSTAWGALGEGRASVQSGSDGVGDTEGGSKVPGSRSSS